MRDTNGVIGPGGDVGEEQPINLKAVAGFAVAGTVVYAAVSYFGGAAIVAIGAATVGAIACMALRR